MSGQPENVSGVAAGNFPGDGGEQLFSVGAALRGARTHLGLSVDEVSNRIKFAPRQIEALEADDFAHLPETAFLRGFVRSYARMLQLDAAPLLAALPQAPGQLVPVEATVLAEVPFPGVYSTRKPNIVWLAAALAVALVLALFVWFLGRAPEAPRTVVETVALSAASSVPAEPAVVMPDTPAASSVVQPAANNSAVQQAAAIHLTFNQDSWVEITDKNGKLLLSKLNPRGSELDVDGSPPFSLVIGHAKAVRLYYKGQAIDLAPYINVEVARLTLK